MSFLIATHWIWLVVALVAGAVAGAWSAALHGAHTDRFWVFVRWTIAILAVGLAVAMLRWLPEREGLYLETLLMLLFCFVVGAAVARAGRQARLSGRARVAGEAKAAEAARRAAEAKAAEDARRAAEAKAAQDARRAAEAKAAEDGRRAAEAKAAEDARRATEAKAAEARRAAETKVAKAAAPPPAPPMEDEGRHPGRRPNGFAAPRGGTADDLKRIKGIGRQNEGRLHGIGIWHFDQMAAWSDDNVKWIGSYLAFPHRIEREKWIDQARELAASRETKFSRRVASSKVRTSKDNRTRGRANIDAVDPGKEG
jgi:predicted flap endonuclease-1-like 5' DNA nuclease